MIEINRSKLMPKVLLGLAVLITIIGLTTSARAGVPPFAWEYMGYDPISSFGPDVEIQQDKPCLWSVASACTEEEIELGWFPEPPFNHKLYIDGEKINLRRFTFIDEWGIFGDLGLKWWVFYQVFEAGYFEVGVYEIVHKVLVQKPYNGSDIHGWRVFVNFAGPVDLYGPLEWPWIVTYNLIVTPPG